MARRSRGQRVMMVPRLILLVGIVVTSSCASPAWADHECDGVYCDVGGDDSAIVGQGALLIPGASDVGVRAASSASLDCPDCEWKLVIACPSGDPTDPNDQLCIGASVNCPPDRYRFIVNFRRPPAPFSRVGEVCLGGGVEPLSPDAVGRAVRDRFVEILPAARPGYQPPNGTLVNLPTIFMAGQPSEIGPESLSLLGFDIVLTADAGWTWTFEPGVSQAFDVPGGRYPNQDVTYTYEQPGPRSVSVTTTWTGEFTADGLGPFPVAGPPVTQTADLALDVREARARLVAD